MLDITIVTIRPPVRAITMPDIQTIEDVAKAIKQCIADLEAAGIAVPASLRLAAILSQRHADDRRQP